MDDRVLPFVLQSLSLPNISKLAGVLISSRESAISDVVEATGVLPDDAKQKLLAVCSKAALLPALLDGHAHMGRVAGAGDMTEWKEKNMKGASLIIANLDFHGEGVRRAPQAGPNMVYALGIHPRFANQLYNIDLAAFAECARNGGFAAVGETGLCSKWMKEKNPVRLHLQQKLLHFHILVSKASGLPLILHLRSNEGLDCLRTTSNMLEKEGLPFNHPIMIHCYKGQLEEANAWLTKWTETLFSFNVYFAETLPVAANLPLSNLTVESDAPYLGKDPTSTHVLIEQLAALRQVSVEHLKLAMLSNMLRFLQPSLVASDNWPKVFEFAKSFARKPTDMSVVSRHVRHFTTTTRPQLKWSETDLENY